MSDNKTVAVLAGHGCGKMRETLKLIRENNLKVEMLGDIAEEFAESGKTHHVNTILVSDYSKESEDSRAMREAKSFTRMQKYIYRNSKANPVYMPQHRKHNKYNTGRG